MLRIPDIIIPSEPMSIPTIYRKKNSSYPPIDIDMGWYTSFYDQLEDEEIIVDLCIRLQYLEEDYTQAAEAVEEGRLQDEVILKNKIQENIIVEEYERVWRYVSDEGNKAYFKYLSKMIMTKMKFLEMIF